jgi:ribosomal protein L14
MRSDFQTLFEELFKACEIGEEEMVTGAVLVMRLKHMGTGDTTVAIGQTEDTDGVVKLGLLHSAIEVQQQEEWRRPDGE